MTKNSEKLRKPYTTPALSQFDLSKKEKFALAGCKDASINSNEEIPSAGCQLAVCFAAGES